MQNSEQFWNASLEELKRGYIDEGSHYTCLLCGKKTEKGIIHPEDGVLYEAERYAKLHIGKVHQSVFEYLIALDKRITGLTDHQNSLLRLFHQGKSDPEIQKEMGIGSASTIRNHRFAFKEKERQSKVLLAMMELIREKDRHAPAIVSPRKTATMVDDRYNVTQEEREEILRKYFTLGTDGPLKNFPAKEKYKLVLLQEITSRFESRRIYTEKEVNQVLKTAYDDFATLRRYLIAYGFMDRKPDGSQYWLKESTARKAGKELKPVDRKEELKRQYKESKPEAGIYQIRNTRNQKALVVATPNLKTINGKRFELQMGSFNNAALQQEWKEFGEEAFVFEVLEVLEKKEDEFLDVKDALKKMEAKWLEKLQPYGERGYNGTTTKSK